MLSSILRWPKAHKAHIRLEPMHHYLRQKHLLVAEKTIEGSNRTQPKLGPARTAVPSQCRYLLLFFCCRKRVEGGSSDMYLRCARRPIKPEFFILKDLPGGPGIVGMRPVGLIAVEAVGVRSG